MTNRTLFPIALSVLAILLSQTPAYSGIYKWVDDNGVMHYSDQPNKPNAKEFKIEEISTTKPRTVKTKKDDSEIKNDNQVAPKETEFETPKISKTEKRRLCKQAKSDISGISSRGRMREVNAKGEYIYLSEKQRQKRLSAAKKKKREYCR